MSADEIFRKEQHLSCYPDLQEMWSPYSCFIVTLWVIAFFKADGLQGSIIQQESFYTHTGHWQFKIYLACVWKDKLFSLVFLSRMNHFSSSLCWPNLTRLLSGGAGKPWPDSGHYNEDLGEEECPNQLHWIPTAHGSWWRGRWAWDMLEQVLL